MSDSKETSARPTEEELLLQEGEEDTGKVEAMVTGEEVNLQVQNEVKLFNGDLDRGIMKKIRDEMNMRPMERQAVFEENGVTCEFPDFPQAPAEVSKKIADFVIRGQYRPLQMVMARLHRAQMSIPISPEIETILNHQVFIFNDEAFNFNFPVGLFPKEYRQSNFCIITCSPYQVCLTLGAPTPADKISENLTGMYLWIKMTRYSLREIRKLVTMSGQAVPKISN